MAPPTTWTAERISIVRNLLVDEGLTRAEIAARMDVSESAIIHIIEKYGYAGLSRSQQRNGHAKPRAVRSS
jgi:transposase